MALKWYIAQGKQPKPISEAELKNRIRRGALAPDTLVDNNQLRKWTPVRSTAIWRENAPAAKSTRLGAATAKAATAMHKQLQTKWVLSALLAVSALICILSMEPGAGGGGIQSITTENRDRVLLLFLLLVATVSVWAWRGPQADSDTDE